MFLSGRHAPGLQWLLAWYARAGRVLADSIAVPAGASGYAPLSSWAFSLQEEHESPIEKAYHFLHKLANIFNISCLAYTTIYRIILGQMKLFSGNPISHTGRAAKPSSRKWGISERPVMVLGPG